MAGGLRTCFEIYLFGGFYGEGLEISSMKGDFSWSHFFIIWKLKVI